MRNVGHQRPEAHAGADADQQAVRRRKHQQVRRQPGGDEAEAETEGRDGQGNGGADAVRHPPQREGAEGESQHHRGVGQRGGRTVDAELRLRPRQDDDDRPHARPEQGRDHERQPQAQEGVGAVGPIAVGGFEGLGGRAIHYANELAGSGRRWQARGGALWLARHLSGFCSA